MSEPKMPRVLTAVVADDEPAARDVIRGFLQDEPSVALIAEARNGEQTVSVVREVKPDLLFLDIQMPGKDGFDVLEDLGNDVPKCVIFVTAHDQHALRAFEVHALDYLLKPFGRPRFQAALARATQALAGQSALALEHTYDALVQGQRSGRSDPGELVDESGSDPSARSRPRRIGVRVGSRIVLVNLEDVDWVEADGDYVRLHVGRDIHLVSRRLSDLANLLDPHGHVQIHRSIIVKIDRVRELRRDPDGGGIILLDDGVQLRVARARWEDVERSLVLAP